MKKYFKGKSRFEKPWNYKIKLIKYRQFVYRRIAGTRGKGTRNTKMQKI